MHQDYGKRPGVTTVIGRNLGWNKGPLMQWAYKQGKKGVPLYEERDKAADVGTAIHDRIEAYINGWTIPSMPETFTKQMAEQTNKGFTSFRTWHKKSNLVFVATEGWGIDEYYQTGWTLDAIGLDPSAQVFDLIDWKSSKGIYSDHLIQTVAYMGFANRLLGASGVTLPFRGVRILRVDKETEIFQEAFLPLAELKPMWDCFEALRTLETHRYRAEQLAKVAWKISTGLQKGFEDE